MLVWPAYFGHVSPRPLITDGLSGSKGMEYAWHDWLHSQENFTGGAVLCHGVIVYCAARAEDREDPAQARRVGRSRLSGAVEEIEHRRCGTPAGGDFSQGNSGNGKPAGRQRRAARGRRDRSEEVEIRARRNRDDAGSQHHVRPPQLSLSGRLQSPVSTRPLVPALRGRRRRGSVSPAKTRDSANWVARVY